MGKTSPKTSQCPHCKRLFTRKGVREHLRHVRCSPTSTATPKKFERARCRYCHKSFHSGNSLRAHVAGQHPSEYAKSPHSVKRHKALVKPKSAEPQADRARQPSHAKAPKKSAPRPSSRTEHPLHRDADAAAVAPSICSTATPTLPRPVRARMRIAADESGKRPFGDKSCRPNPTGPGGSMAHMPSRMHAPAQDV